MNELLVDLRFTLIQSQLKQLVDDNAMPSYGEDDEVDNRRIFARLSCQDVDFYLSCYCPKKHLAYAFCYNKHYESNSDFGTVRITDDIITMYRDYGIDIHDLCLDQTWPQGIALDKAMTAPWCGGSNI